LRRERILPPSYILTFSNFPVSQSQQYCELENALKSVLKDTGEIVKIPEEFLHSVERIGAHRAICDFLKPDGGMPEALLKLHQTRKLTLSIESLVLQPKWKEFFDEHLLIEASKRLQEIGTVMT